MHAYILNQSHKLYNKYIFYLYSEPKYKLIPKGHKINFFYYL